MSQTPSTPPQQGPNRIWAGWWTLFLAAVILFSFPLLQSRIPWLKDHAVPYSLGNGIFVQPKVVVDTAQARIDSLQELGQPNPELDSILQARAYTGGPGLDNFFQAIKEFEQGKRKKLRIAYFGDSMTEGDLIVKKLRQLMQGKFGGEGVGFVAISSETAGYRNTIKHTFEKEAWKATNQVQSKINKKDSLRPDFGISGEYFLAPGGNAWVKYEGVKAYSGLQTFKDVYLFYGRNKADTSAEKTSRVTLHTSRGDSVAMLTGSKRVNTARVFSGSTPSLQADFAIDPGLPLFGFSFESPKGIHVDNYALRGTSGLPLTSISSEVLTRFNAHMDYDLIILHYGLNVVSKDSADYTWYSQGFYAIVDHMKRCFPHAAILVVSISDMAGTVKGNLQTLPGVPQVNDIQRNVAMKLQTGFFNLYAKMGGEGSMIKWVEEKKLAGTDYTHVNGSGADLIGKWIYEYLMEEKEKVGQPAAVQGDGDKKEELKNEAVKKPAADDAAPVKDPAPAGDKKEKPDAN